MAWVGVTARCWGAMRLPRYPPATFESSCGDRSEGDRVVNASAEASFLERSRHPARFGRALMTVSEYRGRLRAT